MKDVRLLIFVLHVFVRGTLLAQNGVECLDIKYPFELFVSQVKNNGVPVPIKESDAFLKDTVYLKVNFNENVRYDYLIKGISVFVVNSTNEDIVLSKVNTQAFFAKPRMMKEFGATSSIEGNNGIVLVK